MSGARVFAITLLILGVAGLCPAVDLDYGATLDSATTYGDRPSTTDDTWEQRAKAAIWLAADLSPAISFDAQVSYLYTQDRPYLVDLDRFVLSGTTPTTADTVMSWSAGRMPFYDPSGLVLNHTADGLSATWGTPALKATALAAYTGLLLKPESNLNMSAADSVDDEDDDVFFAPKRLIAGAELALPEIFARQTPVLFFLAQFDLRSETESRVTSQYSGLKISGPLAPALYYDASVILETGRDEAADEALLALLGSAGVRYYDPALAYARLEIRALYASGSGGSLDPFLPISKPTLALAYAPPLSDLLGGQASLSFKPFFKSPVRPLRSLQIFGQALFLASAADPSYTGTLLDAGVNARPVSDFGMALKAGVWLPDGGDTEYAVRLEASLAL